MKTFIISILLITLVGIVSSIYFENRGVRYQNKKLYNVQDNKIEDVVVENNKEEYPYEHFIRQKSKKYSVDHELVLAVIKKESSFIVSAKSHKGAIGLMQLMPKTAKWLGVDPNCPKDNIRGGILYLSMQLKKYNDVRLALAAYNAGGGNVDKYGKNIPPFKETQKYVRDICLSYKKCDHTLSLETLG